MSHPWCMYKSVSGTVITQMFLPQNIPSGWYDSPGAAEEGGDDWVTAEQNGEHMTEKSLSEVYLKESYQDQKDREKALNELSSRLEDIERKQEARDEILDDREVELKLREDALADRQGVADNAKLVKVDGRSKAARDAKKKGT